jgi:hypothetical protein
MTREDIVRMAKEAGMESFNICVELDDFAKLVAQHEREACWNVVAIALLGSDIELTKRVAKAIRARSKE